MPAKYSENDIKSIIEHPTANHFKYLFSESPQALAYVSNTGHYIKVNKALCELLEYSETELLRKKIEDVTHPEDLFIELEEIKKLEAGEYLSFFLIKKYITKTGKVLPCLLTKSRINDDQGNLLHYVSYLMPIQNGTLEKIRQYVMSSDTQSLRFKERLLLWIADNWKTALTILLVFITGIVYLLGVKEDFSKNIDDLIQIQTDLLHQLEQK